MLKKSGPFDFFLLGIDRLSLTISENKAHIQNLQCFLINHEFYDKKCLILSSSLDISVYIIEKTVKTVVRDYCVVNIVLSICRNK